MSMNTLVCVSKIKGIKGVRYHRPAKISNVKSRILLRKRRQLSMGPGSTQSTGSSVSPHD